jgi:hypothetical protein
MDTPATEHPHWLRPLVVPGTPAYWRDVYRDADLACMEHPPSPAFRVDLVPLDAGVDHVTIHPCDASFYCNMLYVANDLSHLDTCNACLRKATERRDARVKGIPAHHRRVRADVKRLCQLARRQQAEAVQVGFGF